MNEPFVDRIRLDYKRIGNKNQFADVLRISGPWPQVLKGFLDYVNIFKLPNKSL